jgi:hypothetical protein
MVEAQQHHTNRRYVGPARSTLVSTCSSRCCCVFVSRMHTKMHKPIRHSIFVSVEIVAEQSTLHVASHHVTFCELLSQVNGGRRIWEDCRKRQCTSRRYHISKPFYIQKAVSKDHSAQLVGSMDTDILRNAPEKQYNSCFKTTRKSNVTSFPSSSDLRRTQSMGRFVGSLNYSLRPLRCMKSRRKNMLLRRNIGRTPSPRRTGPACR